MEVLKKASAARKVASAKVAALVTLAAAGAATALPASAAGIDVSEVVTAIKDYAGATSPIVLIGGAILLVTVVIASISWVRRSVK